MVAISQAMYNDSHSEKPPRKEILVSFNSGTSQERGARASHR